MSTMLSGFHSVEKENTQSESPSDAVSEIMQDRFWSSTISRYEITEIPLPSSVIEQINKNNVQATPNPGQVTPSGVPIETAVTRIVQLPQPAPLQPCPLPSPCPCPCPPPPSSGNALNLRLLPKTNNQSNAHCTSMCICLCISGSFPSRVSPPNTSAPSSEPNSNAIGAIPVVTSPLSNRIGTTLLSSAPSASKSTPTISATSGSISVTCPGLSGCVSSGNPVISFSRTSNSVFFY
ncbi:hypothetical protein OS493_001480 [Desmophyllum pertusum]|uniref:Uncharacterized protein n=1 Tax=Desmophyllum pertusum TaxID=174260 RepID=A0A9W9ZIN0_9CNID|nr:hypothetical protein OS493_001480 [Desmophyllum pertusum]